jgi:hypothetical protein
MSTGSETKVWAVRFNADGTMLTYHLEILLVPSYQ